MFTSLKYTLYSPLSTEISTFLTICRNVLFKITFYVEVYLHVYKVHKQSNDVISFPSQWLLYALPH